MSARSKGREIALQILYQFDLSEKYEVDEALKSYIASFEEEDKPLKESSISFARERVHLVLSRKDEIDKIIDQHATHWKLARMASIDRNILRLAKLNEMRQPHEVVSFANAIQTNLATSGSDMRPTVCGESRSRHDYENDDCHHNLGLLHMFVPF
jgi:N utilization substance protein B